MFKFEERPILHFASQLKPIFKCHLKRQIIRQYTGKTLIFPPKTTLKFSEKRHLFAKIRDLPTKETNPDIKLKERQTKRETQPLIPLELPN